MLSSLFIAQTVTAIGAALESAGAGRRPIAVLGQARIGRALADGGHSIVFVSDKPRSLRRVVEGQRVYGLMGALPLADNVLGAVVATGIGQRDDWERLMREWSRPITNGGVLILVERGAPSEFTRVALCSGLAEIEQRQAGRTFVTSGLVSKF